MARSPEYWYDYIIAQKESMSSLTVLQPAPDNAQTLLNEITTTSRVARWRLWIWAVAACAYAIDVVFDLAILTFEALAKNSRYGTIPWYESEAMKFQFGDALVFQTNQYVYPSINPANQIIKRAAGKENGNVTVLKVAKLVGNIPTKLNPTEYSAHEAYWAKKKPAGVELTIISDDPDEVRLFLKVYFDPTVFDTTGQLISSPGSYPVNDAINDYLSNLNDDLKGILELSNLISKIKSVPGIPSAYVIQASGRYGANPYNVFTERYEPNAGHMIVDPTNPLSATISYDPYYV